MRAVTGSGRYYPYLAKTVIAVSTTRYMDHSSISTTMITAHSGVDDFVDISEYLPVSPKVKGTRKERQWLIDECDRLMSLFVRQYYGKGCVTCEPGGGMLANWRYLENGHFQKRTLWPTRYNIKNCGPQCRYCNSDGSGEKDRLLGAWLDQTWGAGTAEEMRILAHQQTPNFTIDDLQIIRLHFYKALQHHNFSIR